MSTPPENVTPGVTPGVLRRLLRQQLYLAALLGLGLWLVYQVRAILSIFIFSFILAYLLGPFVRRVAGPEGKGLSRGAAALVVYLLVIAALGGALYALYYILRDEIAAYAHDYHRYCDALLAGLRAQEAHGVLRALPRGTRDALNTLVGNSDALLAETARTALPALVHTAPRLVELIAVPIVAYYLLIDGRRFVDLARRLVRPGGRDHFDRLIGDIDRSLRGYLVGQVILSLVAGVAAFAILHIAGVRPAIVVGLAAAVLELIPVVGPLLWVLAAILLTAIQQPGHTLLVAALLLAAHQADMHLLAPRILGHHLRLHPVVVIFALLAGNALAGILGVLLAAPLAALLNIALTYLLTEGALSPADITHGDEIPLPSAAPGPPVQGEFDRPKPARAAGAGGGGATGALASPHTTTRSDRR